ncbi:Six-hairpin glycosidase-like protein [Scenedesmus sp. NREL 46B-D3]|nr:Six-hairpin glycosidase-like protein [Scenedesmus sp. NREL 46B-D3]
MAAGGLYDQLGGGFHRYSVDEYWHVPHFEKMMYDNPQLALTYLDAFRITLASQKQQQKAAGGSSSSSSGAAGTTAAAAGAGAALFSPAAAAAAAAAAGDGVAAAGSSSSSLAVEDAQLMDPTVYATVVRGVLDYMRRDMTHPEGGLYSAEDADSQDAATSKKAEGAFYVWTADEVVQVLGEERAGLFAEVYGVQQGGNCNLSARSDPHQEFTGKNVLMQFMQLGGVSSVQQEALPLARAQQLLGECRQLLFAQRAGRPRPSLDDKVVTAWNGQAISAYALASRVLPAEQPPAPPCFPVEGCTPGTYLQAAVAAARFVKEQLWDEGAGRLRRAFCKAPSTVEGFADDYALLIAGLLDLYEAGGGLDWLRWALQLQDTLDSLFWDSSSGGYFQGSGADPSIKLRLKEDYDGAEPAPSSIAAANLLRLAALLPQGGARSAQARDAVNTEQPLVHQQAQIPTGICLCIHRLAMHLRPDCPCLLACSLVCYRPCS